VRAGGDLGRVGFDPELMVSLPPSIEPHDEPGR
jgi:hypothetical protein